MKSMNQCSSWSKTQKFPLSANPGGRPCVQPGVFRTEYVSINKTASRNISPTANKQRASWRKIWVVFHLGIPKTAFLMRNLPTDPRKLGIFPNKQGHSCQFPKKEHRRPPSPPW